MARKLKIKRPDKKEIKREVEENFDFHLLMFSVYKAASLFLEKFHLKTQFGINRHTENGIIDTKNIKIKSLKGYPILENFEGIGTVITQITKSMLMLHNDTLRKKYNLDGRIYTDASLHKAYDECYLEYGLPYKIKWDEDIKSEDKEVEDALKTLADSVVRFKVVEDLIYRDIEIDIPTRKYIRTMITKFNNSFLPYVTEIIES
jgi:hypothetical protein|nr:MAG TPA: hypothetical protein [Caudoviricetes sp.]DAY25830.1 MAG TPA: hypothetical protein [Caudoviricetes sp.]